jgi:hypothetical protein
MLSTAVEESRAETLRAYESVVAAAAQADWDATKRRVLEELGHVPSSGDAAAEMDLTGAGDSFLGRRPTASPARVLSASTLLAGSVRTSTHAGWVSVC